MPVTLQLSTMPGAIERYDTYSTQVLEVFGDSLDRQSVVIAKIADIRPAVRAFGATVRAAHPDASFLISVRTKQGERKLRGYDSLPPDLIREAAERSNGFGQGDFLHVMDRRTKPPAAAETPIAAPLPSTAA